MTLGELKEVIKQIKRYELEKNLMVTASICG